eukprot:scaffold25860_cov105-Isochrysis_galbana.AAC.3
MPRAAEAARTLPPRLLLVSPTTVLPPRDAPPRAAEGSAGCAAIRTSSSTSGGVRRLSVGSACPSTDSRSWGCSRNRAATASTTCPSCGPSSAESGSKAKGTTVRTAAMACTVTRRSDRRRSRARCSGVSGTVGPYPLARSRLGGTPAAMSAAPTACARADENLGSSSSAEWPAMCSRSSGLARTARASTSIAGLLSGPRSTPWGLNSMGRTGGSSSVWIHAA